MADSERSTYSRPVDPEKDSTLIEVLKYRGTFDDVTYFDASTGRTHPEVITALDRATGSLLRYADGGLEYTEGDKGFKADEHGKIFMDSTIDPSRDN